MSRFYQKSPLLYYKTCDLTEPRLYDEQDFKERFLIFKHNEKFLLNEMSINRDV